jgi:hypothetical protein
MSLFAAGTLPPAVTDLEGLLLGVAQVVRLGGTARLSVVVEDRWRVAAVLAAYDERGLRGEQAPTVEGQTSVRTPFSRHLEPLADRWVRGAIKCVPHRFVLDGPRLRLWAVAAGRTDDHGYLFRLSPNDVEIWQPAGAALAAAGLAASFLGPRAAGPAYRIVGQRRLARLREYLGDAPDGATATDWPTGE